MNRQRVVSVFVLAAALVLTSALAPTMRPVAAQAAPEVTLTLTASTAKAKVGDLVAFTARVENIGTESIPNFLVNLNLPDALNARAINCPGETSGSTTFCAFAEFPAGSIAEVLFVAEVGSREPNGPVSVSASSEDIVLATATTPPLKIRGSKKS